LTLAATGKKIEELVKNSELSVINIDESLEYLEIALRTEEHPFQETFQSNDNFFVKAIDFGLTNCRALLYTIARSMFTLESLACFDAKKVIKLAVIFTNIVCSRNPNMYCGFKKKVSVFAQACGMSNDGLDIFATLGIMETSK
jgi:hypothetical protein